MGEITSSLLLRWKEHLTRGALGVPLVPALFVAEQGDALLIADVRDVEQASGVLGFLPGSSFPSVEHLEEVARARTETRPLVLVCATGEQSGRLARRLQDLGLEHVAAMAGGISAWREQGLRTSRDISKVRAKLGARALSGENVGPLTIELVRTHIGDPAAVRWIKMPMMLAHGCVSCIDGRDERGIIGAPGGDGGEFLLLLAAIEQLKGVEFDAETVELALLERLDEFGRFYLHTDEEAFEVLKSALHADPRTRAAVAGLSQDEAWLEFLGRPSQELQAAVLEHLLRPSHIGCGHLGLMLQNSELYELRAELVESFLSAFFRLWWRGAVELDYSVIPGRHDEEGVLNIELADGVWSQSYIPLISPAWAGKQVFVHHAGVMAYFRRTMVHALVRGRGPLGLERADERALQTTVAALAQRQLQTTSAHLAKDLPLFDVIFAADGSYEVRGEPSAG